MAGDEAVPNLRSDLPTNENVFQRRKSFSVTGSQFDSPASDTTLHD